MYEESINLLRKCGIRLEKGLSLSELNKAEKLYQIQFPESLKNFLMIALPISKGFYNWRNTQKSNVQFIKDIMERPFQDINEAADIVYWCDDWGVEPTNTMNFASEVRKKLKNAPKLLPIYAHRYMPMVMDKTPPVLSLHGLDIIYYGKNLEDYLRVEFGDKSQNEIEFDSIPHIPFWSDIM